MHDTESQQDGFWLAWNLIVMLLCLLATIITLCGGPAACARWFRQLDEAPPAVVVVDAPMEGAMLEPEPELDPNRPFDCLGEEPWQ